MSNDTKKSKKPPAKPKAPEQLPATKAKDLVSIEQWQTDLVTSLVKEVFGVIAREEKALGREFGERVRFSVLTSVVATIVYGTLSAKLTSPNRTQAAEREAHMRFQDIQEAVENTVAAGFEGAVRSWSGGQEEFMCQIDIEPPAINYEDC